MRISTSRAVPLAGLILLVAAPQSARAEKFECLVEPYVEVEISSSVPGILAEVHVDRGDFVEKDRPLAALESAVEQARYDLAKARMEFAARKAQRNEELYRKQMISIHEKDELETELALLRLELRESEELLKRRTILSPIDGVVVERMYSPGEFVQQEPIFKMAQIDPLRVEVSVPVRLYGKIHVGMTGQVEWETPLGGSHAARVTVVDPVIDAASGTIGIRLELRNPDHRLPAGSKCLVQFPIGD